MTIFDVSWADGFSQRVTIITELTGAALWYAVRKMARQQAGRADKPAKIVRTMTGRVVWRQRVGV